MSILVLGTVALDTVKTPFGIRRKMLGGSAAHFSIAARLFTDVHLVAVVGEDFPERHLRLLGQKGIILDSLIGARGKTFHWKGEYSGDLNTALTLSTELGVLTGFRPVVSEAQKGIKNIFLANVDPDIQNHLLDVMRSPGLIGLDSMNYWINNKRASLFKLLKRVHIFVANDQEARLLSGESNLIRAARYLRSRGPRIVLIKKGEHGVLACGAGFPLLFPAYPTDKVVDPTGAGDTFAGGFMGFLAQKGRLNETNLKKAIGYGTVAASYNVEGFGLERTARLSLKDLDIRLRKLKEALC